MANVIEGKYENMYKLLSEHMVDLNLTDKLKCTKCRNILIDACQSPCGCRFCRKCVDEMLVNGIRICPGNTAECKNEDLSNIMPDYRINLKISKLRVKCPEQMCEHESQLMEMEEHMRLCSKKTVQCPCHSLGCHGDNLVVDKINEHLQTDSYNHWTMLMGLIGDFRNEIAQLRKTENGNINEIEMARQERRIMRDDIKLLKIEAEMLREEGRAKDERIEAMRNEIRKCQVEADMLRSQIDIGKETVGSNVDGMTDEMNGQIESIRMEIANLSGELNEKLEGIRVEMDGRFDEMTQGCMEHVDGQLGLINGIIDKYQEETTGRIEMINTCLERKIDKTICVWPLNEISKISDMCTSPSEYFVPKWNKYKMVLWMWNKESQLQIRLYIYPGPNDADLHWPFQANVTVKLTNKAHPGAWQVVTEYCEIDRPPDGKCRSSAPFIFPIPDLSSKGLLQDDCCIVECLVDIE